MIGPRAIVGLVAAASATPLAGCAIGKLVGGMAQNFEYQKLVQVHPEYDGLEGRTVAVLVDVDMATMYEHADVAITVAHNVAREIQDKVPGARVLSPAIVQEWKFRTPQWNAMPYSEIAESLGVDRVVYIDIHEYRLHPPGNQWLWEGVCSAHVGVIEAGGLDPDNFADMFTVHASFPDIAGLGRESADARRIQTGLLALFVRDTAWLFYLHLEPKHPDKFQGEVPEIGET